MRQGLTSMLLQTPLFHNWIKYVVPNFNIRHLATAEKNRIGTITLRTVAQITLMMPTMTSAFLFGIGTLKYKSIPEGVRFWRENFWTAYKTGLCFWPPIFVSLYSYILPHYVKYADLYMNCWNLIFAVMMSYIANQK